MSHVEKVTQWVKSLPMSEVKLRGATVVAYGEQNFPDGSHGFWYFDNEQKPVAYRGELS